MSAAVFISWSGQRCESIARTFYQLIQDVFREIDRPVHIAFSPLSQTVGVDWRSQLEDNLAQCDFGLILLDPASLRSAWVAYEAGVLAGGVGRAREGFRLFPLLLCESLQPVRGTPFESLHCAVLSPQGLEQLFEALFRVSSDTVPKSVVALLAKDGHERVARDWDHIRTEEARTGAGLALALKEMIQEYAAFQLIDDSTADQLGHLLSASRERLPKVDTSLARELAEIARLFHECGSSDNGEFGLLATQWAVRNLIIDAKQRLSEITLGRLPIRNRAPVREFWRDSVFGRARESVWTTNVAKPGANMGGAPDRQLLAAQEAAIQRDPSVRVTRLFVYDPGMSSEEAEQRRILMRRQIEIDINVLVITHADFRTKSDAENAYRRIGSDDFMIIDDQFLYLTIPDETDEIEATLLNGRQHLGKLEAARAFKDVLEAWADTVTTGNVDRFPNIPA